LLRPSCDKIGQLWLNVVLPLVDCRLVRDGALTCTNAAVERVAEPADEYRIRWHRFDNEADIAQPVGDEAVSKEPRFNAHRNS
jgi:hypothetical protein